VRVGTWNIQLGLHIDEVVEAIEEHRDFHGLDLLCLQEASAHDGRPDAARIANAMGAGYDHIQVTAQVRRGLPQANALIWRRAAFEPGTAQIVSLSSPAGGVTLAERTVLRAILPQQRIAVRAESAALRVYVVHLDVIGFRHKLEQFKAVIADMVARPPVRVTVVAGDLNTFGPPAWQLWRRLHAAATEAGLVEVTKEVGRTHWTAQKLDAIFLQTEVPFTSRAWALDLRASDHQPVFADIELEASSAKGPRQRTA
jgi:endonuclease/exonuclease/phosphatase family metal-dependent hydrolase